MIGGITDCILGLHDWAALAVVFLLPALESSAFVGFVVPDEVGVLLGGVVASQHSVGLGPVLAAGVPGAIVGDSVGYAVGKRWGPSIPAVHPAHVRARWMGRSLLVEVELRRRHDHHRSGERVGRAVEDAIFRAVPAARAVLWCPRAMPMV